MQELGLYEDIEAADRGSSAGGGSGWRRLVPGRRVLVHLGLGVVMLGMVVAIIVLGVFQGRAKREQGSPHPHPPGDGRPVRQTGVQEEVWNSANKKAQNASMRATSGLLSLLNSTEFRTQTSNISVLQGREPRECLEIVRAVITSSPVQHNFPLRSAMLDVNLTIMSTHGFVPNYFTATLEGLLIPSAAGAVQDYAETHLMGFPSFANSSSPTLQEALTRPQYTCINIHGVAGGCVAFGEMSLVSRPSWVRNMTIISAIDTGLFTGFCLLGAFPGGNGTQDNSTQGFLGLRDLCSAWDGTVATFEHFDHALLPNMIVWNSSLAYLLQERFNGATVNLLNGIIGYLEGNVAGALLIPESVSYVQLGVSGVLGTSLGSKAVDWAKSQRWPLVWAQGIPTSLGIAGGGGGSRAERVAGLTEADKLFEVLDLTRMFLDPNTARATTNISVPNDELLQSQEIFNAAWARLETTDSSLQNSTDITYWHGIFQGLWESMSPSLRVRYPDPFSCADQENCFAVQLDTGDCICRTT